MHLYLYVGALHFHLLYFSRDGVLPACTAAKLWVWPSKLPGALPAATRNHLIKSSLLKCILLHGGFIPANGISSIINPTDQGFNINMETLWSVKSAAKMQRLCNLGKLQFKWKKMRILSSLGYCIHFYSFFYAFQKAKAKLKLDLLLYSLFKHFNIQCLAVQRTDN